MQNGKQITEIIRQLRQTGHEWEKYAAGRDNPPEKEIALLKNRLIYFLRAELKTEDAEAVLKYLMTEGMSEETAAGLVERVKDTLQFYFRFHVFRELEKTDETKLQGLLTAVYEKYIVRFERGYLQQIRPELCSAEEWNEIADRMEYLTDYYVSRSYTRKGIAEDLMDETGLKGDTCEYWAELIEKNYLLLKLNYISAELENLKDAQATADARRASVQVIQRS